MKNLFKKTMLFAAAAMAFVSCSNDNTNDVITTPGVEVSICATTNAARSAFGEPTDGTYPTFWEENDEWNTAINSTMKKARTEDITFSDDFTTATASVKYETIPTADNYTLRAISPYANNNACVSDDFVITIADTQTPKETSCDGAAQVLVARSETITEPTMFNISFKHATAYAKFSFTNLNLGDAVVNNVVIESEIGLVGKWNFNYDTEVATENSAKKIITLATTATENLWFACAPVDVSDKTLTFTINTNQGPLSKVVKMPSNREFKPGVISTFNVNMAGIEFSQSVKWELVTNAEELAVGDEIIIAAASDSKALSTEQKSSNRGATSITKDGNYITDPSDAVQVITLEAGTKSGTFAFNVGTLGYLYAASSSGNQLKSKTTKDDNGSWVITIASNGEAKVVAQGTYTRNEMRYNANNGSPLFACYASTSTTGTPVAIYRLPSNKPVIAANAATAPVVGGEGLTATYTLKNIATDDIEIESFEDNITDATKTANGVITYNIKANHNKGAKTSTISLRSPSTGATATISVTQAAPVFTVAPTSLTLEAAANSTATFTVTSDFKATITVSDEAKWSVSPAEVEAGVATTITVKALTKNTGADAVTGTITVTRTGSVSEEVTVSQKGVQQGGSTEVNKNTVTYTVSSTSACTTSGTAPTGSSATYAQTYNTKEQITANNSATFTLKGYEGATIKGMTLNMKSNASKGEGKFSVVAGSTTLASISSATTFNQWYDNTSYGSTYRDVHVTLTNDTYVIKSGDNVVVKFEATINSIYIHSITIDYEIGGGNAGGDDSGNTGGDDSGNTGGDDSGNTGGGTGEPTTVTMTTFSSTAASMDSVISYSCAKGGGTSNPAANSGAIRLYQNASGQPGGNITITAKEGYTITSVVIGSSMSTSVAYEVDGGSISSKADLAANGKYTISQEGQSITIHCMGTTSSTRLYVNYLSVTYK
ncbi:MAG: hypothetical protein IKV09_01025 [Alistipes sp.]|nr:hypothetical protein [Alistipes sp.]